MIKILSPCGILGYGFPDASLANGLEYKPDAIIVDAGSTDAGPHKLGLNIAIVSKEALRNDLYRLLKASMENDIPLIIGSSGGSGTNKNVYDTCVLIDEICKEINYSVDIDFINCEISKEQLKDVIKENRITKMSSNVPDIKIDDIESLSNIVGQIAHEEIVKVLENGARIIVCGRSYDPAIFAAFVDYKKMDLALGYHLGKILECGAICTTPGSARDCVLGVVNSDSIEIISLNPMRECTVQSVAAHTFYEKDHPYILHGPGTVLRLEDTKFSKGENGVIIKGSRIEKVEKKIKIEAARHIGYRTIVIAGVRDEILISQIVEVEEAVKKQVVDNYSYVEGIDFEVRFLNYGINAIIQKYEKSNETAHEVGVIIDVLGKTQEIANSIASSLRSTFLHFGFENRRSTSGNLAFPLAPSDIPAGKVFEFAAYHLVDIEESEFVKHGKWGKR